MMIEEIERKLREDRMRLIEIDEELSQRRSPLWRRMRLPEHQTWKTKRGHRNLEPGTSNHFIIFFNTLLNYLSFLYYFCNP